MMSFSAVIVLAVAVSVSQAALFPYTTGLIGSPLLRSVGTPEAWTTLHAPRYLTHLEEPRFIETPRYIESPRLLATEGSYLAVNRGSLHTAPLPGHLKSVSSVNLDTALGTY